MRRPRNNAEDRLQMAVVQHIKLRRKAGVFAFAIPNEGKRAPRTAARLKAMGLHPGCPDLCIIVDGLVFGLELKTAKGRQSDAQKFTELEWKSAGGFYAVAHGIDEALELLERWGAIRPNGSQRKRQISLFGEAA